MYLIQIDLEIGQLLVYQVPPLFVGQAWLSRVRSIYQ